MPWNWGARATQSVEVGGSRGSVEDAYKTQSWPNYNAAYLAKRLGHKTPTDAYANRYVAASGIADAAARSVYLDKVTANYRSEADECLKNEFVDWLQGTHEVNKKATEYPNNPGQPKRRYVSGPKSGQTMPEWNPTWWGKNQLTHLDGVRPFLREMKINAEGHELDMNLLAEYGPNNIDQAWAYFKHWVKGRPVAPETCIHVSSSDETVHRSRPTHMGQTRSEMMGIASPEEINAMGQTDVFQNLVGSKSADEAIDTMEVDARNLKRAANASDNATDAYESGAIGIGPSIVKAAAVRYEEALRTSQQSVHVAEVAHQKEVETQRRKQAALDAAVDSSSPDPVAMSDPSGAYTAARRLEIVNGKETDVRANQYKAKNRVMSIAEARASILAQKSKAGKLFKEQRRLNTDSTYRDVLRATTDADRFLLADARGRTLERASPDVGRSKSPKTNTFNSQMLEQLDEIGEHLTADGADEEERVRKVQLRAAATTKSGEAMARRMDIS